jgi:hypothetical protein
MKIGDILIKYSKHISKSILSEIENPILLFEKQ